MEDNINTKKEIKYGFWGTGPLSESVIYALYKNEYIPSFVVTKPDSKVGRHQELTPPAIKKWCEMKNIKVFQPSNLKEVDEEFLRAIKEVDLCVVASYGKIIPENILNTPKFGFLNVHPSMLPLYRGPSPIESQLKDGLKEIGISIMKLDGEMDHGPILIQSILDIKNNDNSQTVEIRSGQAGGELLSNILESYIDGNLLAKEQDHSLSTICKFIKKEDGQINLGDDIESIKNKYRAFTPWPGIFFLQSHKDKEIRVKISEINFEASDIESLIQKVIPESKSEMTFESFKNGYLI